MTRFAHTLSLCLALSLAHGALLTGCGAEDPADSPADRCSPETDEVIAAFANAFALHEAPEWTVEAAYTPDLCYGSPDCQPGESDAFRFEAPEAGRYRFETDFGDLYYARPCSDDPQAGLEFDFEGFNRFEVELFAGEFVGVRSYQWTDSDPAELATYFVRVERLEPGDE